MVQNIMNDKDISNMWVSILPIQWRTNWCIEATTLRYRIFWNYITSMGFTVRVQAEVGRR